MPVKKRNNNAVVPAGMSAKQMRRKKPINNEHLLNIEPLTESQKSVFDRWADDKHLVLHGCAGTGKTFISLYLALREVLNPGDHEDKSALYQIPYKNMVKFMFEMPDDNAFEMLYNNLRTQETISFWSTSYIRGVTLDNCIIIVDEFANLNFHELDSMITRVGQDAKIVFSGDVTQSDLVKQNEKNGVLDFMKILETMEEFSCIEFGVDDIVRSGLVRSYIISKLNLGF